MSDLSTNNAASNGMISHDQEWDVPKPEGGVWDVCARRVLDASDVYDYQDELDDDEDLEVVWLYSVCYQYFTKLSQCTLTLRETILTIEWTGGPHVTVNLNQYVAYIGGELRWVSRGTGGFRSTCQGKSILLEGTVLVASCREGDSGDYQKVRLDLNDYIVFDSETNAFRPHELEFTLTGAEKIVDSSRSLVDITLISSINLSKLLRDPGFYKAIKDVAERAENDAHDQRLAVMSKMNEEVEEIKKEVDELKKRLDSVVSRSQEATEEMTTQLESISEKSTQRFEREMTTLINAVAKEAMKAVYAQIRELELKVLTVEQQKAYQDYWSPPPYKPEGTAESVH
ncbi:hypothetical protein C8J57DRAFT_1244221 [Mycena rebaudengoi]|nr:hypothetical protein C8J57DRAFT_1244221 [Mycena rebaudengoi]